MTARPVMAMLAAGVALGMAAAAADAAGGFMVSVGSNVTCRADQKPVYRGHVVPFRGTAPRPRPSGRFYGWFACEPDETSGIKPPVFPAVSPISSKEPTPCTVCLPSE